MKRHLSQTGATYLIWLILPVFALTAATTQAADINFKNTTKGTVVVQGATYLNKQKTILKAGKALQLRAGESAADVDVPMGYRLIVITDGLNRVLFRDVILYQGNALNLEIQTVPNTPRVRLVPVAVNK